MNVVIIDCLYRFILFSLPIVAGQNQENELDLDRLFAPVFEDSLIVPHILPSVPKEICTVIYEPGLFIVTGKSYFPYQLQNPPEVLWNYRDGKYHTVVALGAIQKYNENETESSTAEVALPEQWWYEWIKVDVLEDRMNRSGVDLQPFLNNTFQPNSTHRIIYTIAVYEQHEIFEFEFDNGENSPQTIIQRHFTPLLNFEKSFPKCVFVSGNYFYIVPKRIVLDSSKVRTFAWTRSM